MVSVYIDCDTVYVLHWLTVDRDVDVLSSTKNSIATYVGLFTLRRYVRMYIRIYFTVQYTIINMYTYGGFEFHRNVPLCLSMQRKIKELVENAKSEGLDSVPVSLRENGLCALYGMAHKEFRLHTEVPHRETFVKLSLCCGGSMVSSMYALTSDSSQVSYK